MNRIQIEIQNELLELAPTLARLREKNPPENFVIPPHYFEGLVDNVLASKDASNASDESMLTSKIKKRNTMRLYAVAATFLIATMAFWLVPKTLNSFKAHTLASNSESEYSQLNEEDIKTLINDSKLEIDSDFLANNLGITEKEFSLNGLENPSNSTEESLKDAIEKYIKENDTSNNPSNNL